MVAHPRPWTHPLAATLMSLPVLALLAASLPGPVAGGETRRSGGSTTTWSSSSSGETLRSETRREKPGSYCYSNTVSDDADSDGPAEVDAWTFSRKGGHWRNTSGSERDWRQAQAAIDGADGDVFWFRRGNDRYLTTDPAAIRNLAGLFAPQEALGHRQGELGRLQGELGRLQGQLGRKQGELGHIQARLGQHQAAVSLVQVSREQRRGDASDELDRRLTRSARRSPAIPGVRGPRRRR